MGQANPPRRGEFLFVSTIYVDLRKQKMFCCKPLTGRNGKCQVRHLGILLGLVVLAGVVAFLMHGSGGGPIHADAGEDTHVGVEGNIYLQTDARWALDRIGGSDEEMRDVGCTVCCSCMALEYCRINISPGRLNELLKAHDGYTDRGWLKWFTVASVTGGKITIEIPEKPTVEKIDSTLRMNYPVIAKVMIGGKIQHWVLIVAKAGEDYLIKDPLGDGKELDKLSKYQSKIHSIRIFKSKTSGKGLLPDIETAELQGQPSRLEQPPTPERQDDFADCTRHAEATLTIKSSIEGGRWVSEAGICPLKGQSVALKVEEVPGGSVRWYRIIPDISKNYKNANWPWEADAYKWVGFARIDYHRKELMQFRGKWQILPLPAAGSSLQPGDAIIDSRYYRNDMGSFWFHAEVAADGTIYRSPGIEDCDKRGISPEVFRMSVRNGEGYIGYLTSFFNVPGLFGSINYQSSNYIGVDCADVLMAALAAWKKKPLEKNYNVAMLVTSLEKVAEFDLPYGNTAKKPRWGSDVRPGDFIAVRYPSGKQYAHIGALYSDANKNGLLDGADIIIHAGPAPLHLSYLKEGNFDGHMVILRPR